MEEKYEVFHEGRSVGTVKLSREGLYYRLVCSCHASDGQIHRLWADGEKIGVLMPDRGALVLETRVAAKRIRPGCSFSLDENRKNFIPIHPGEVFGHLGKLRLAKLAFREGEPGIFLD